MSVDPTTVGVTANQLADRITHALRWVDENLSEHEQESEHGPGACLCGARSWPCPEFEDLQLLDVALGGGGYDTLRAPAARRIGMVARNEVTRLFKGPST